MAAHPLGHLVGARFPGGEYSLAGYENWLAHDALYSVPRAEPHPVVAFIGAQQGMGMTVAELFEWLDSDIDDGPLLAQCQMEFPQALEIGQRYWVSGVVRSIERKHGRSLGVFDLVTCVFHLSDENGEVAASITNTYAITRAGEAV
ncbi:hypothetical protein [Streptomyces sp. NPDC057199]|uniref:hypothetical protein n=1 Tax=Streptomyces sp. NPDC057199 TaxID=3346047 RepID=UPI0036346325